MKLVQSCLLIAIVTFAPAAVFAQQQAPESAPDSQPQVQQELIPEMSFTERFVIGELRDLRIDLERMRQEMIREITQRELAITDRALSYSSNTVNFFFFLVTLGAALLTAFGWRTMQDVKTSAKQMVDKEVQSMLKKSHDHFKKIEEDLKNKEKEIARNQEDVKNMQKMSTLWLQINREKDDRKRLELLDEVLLMDPTIPDAYIMKAGSYLRMGIPEQALEMCDTSLNITQDQSLGHYNRARALAQLQRLDEVPSELRYAFTLAPMLRENAEKEEDFLPLKGREDFEELLLRGS